MKSVRQQIDDAVWSHVRSQISAALSIESWVLLHIYVEVWDQLRNTWFVSYGALEEL